MSTQQTVTKSTLSTSLPRGSTTRRKSRGSSAAAGTTSRVTETMRRRLQASTRTRYLPSLRAAIRTCFVRGASERKLSGFYGSIKVILVVRGVRCRREDFSFHSFLVLLLPSFLLSFSCTWAGVDVGTKPRSCRLESKMTAVCVPCIEVYCVEFF